jgi:hypothetical protein
VQIVGASRSHIGPGFDRRIGDAVGEDPRGGKRLHDGAASVRSFRPSAALVEHGRRRAPVNDYRERQPDDWRSEMTEENDVRKQVEEDAKEDLEIDEEKANKVSGGAPFSKIGDIKGESTDKDHKDWINI